VNVTNTGPRAGDEVVQLYVQHLGAIPGRPRQDLRDYQRITLQPGERREVTLHVPVRSLAYWNTDTHAWAVEGERLRLEVGSSSADIRLDRVIRVAGGQ
jgi:beta-glucosidase